MVEGMTREDVERLMFFEQAREQAEKDIAINSKDAQAYTRLGGAMLELAHFRQGEDAYRMIEQAVAKFRHALTIDPSRHDTLWCLGNAYTSQGFLTADSGKAGSFFDKATACFQDAVDQDPGSDVYRKALDMTKKAPELHAELQRQLAASGEMSSQIGGGGGAAKKQTSSDFWYDVACWGLLVGLGISIIALSRSAAQAVPPPAALK